VNKRIAVFPGSFDPVTIGHTDIINRGLNLFDEIIIAIGINSSKNYLFDMELREQWLKDIYKNNSRVSVKSYKGLTVQFCKEAGAGFILRGVRSVSDMEFERSIAQMNKSMDPAIETVFLFADPSVTAVSSTIVRDIIRNGGDARQFLPESLRL
jgi:pantetheine-phosphate adenylyltransferase